MRRHVWIGTASVVTTMTIAYSGCSEDEATGSTVPASSGSAQGGSGVGGSEAGGAGGAGGMAGGGGGAPCPGRQELCDGVCVPTIVDPNNCGSCGNVCPPGQVCISNGCADGCPPPLSECAGTCVDTSADAKHCGGCDSPCPPNQGCVDGSCQDAVVVGPPPDKCKDGGPPIVIQAGPREECLGDIADSLTYALCSCNDIGVPELSSLFFVDAFDSNKGPYQPNGLGGSVGANGSIEMTAEFEVYGDVRTASGQGLTVGGKTDVHQALHVATGLQIDEVTAVDLDAYVGGSITGNAQATIGGTLHTPSCAAVPGSVNAAACVDGAVSVPNPCNCDPASLLPIDAIVAHYANPANNDNALINLSPSALSQPGSPSALLLPCGIYYLDRIQSSGAVTIAVEGHTAIVVGGSIEVSSPMVFTLGPTSTLDVIVGGQVYASALLTVGSAAYPAKSRFYVGGVCKDEGAGCSLNADCCSLQCDGGTCSGSGNPPAWSVKLTGNTYLNGGFYAPFGAFATSSDLEMYGALFVGWYDAEAPSKIHYDQAFIKEGEDCPDDRPDGGGERCGDCEDCGGQACVDFTCDSCTNDGQCCPPLYCVNGECTHIPK